MVLNDYQGYIIAGLLIIIPVILIILEIIEKKIQKKLQGEDLTIEEIYLNKLKEIEIKDARSTLEKIKKISIDFFKKKYKIGIFTDYSSLGDYFEKRGKLREKEFCDLMNEYLYGKNPPTKIDLQNLINLLSKVIIMSKIVEDKEKKEK